MLSTLFFGLIVGGSHAFEADHIAALTSMVSGRSDRRSILRHGLFWGLGHAFVLICVGGVIVGLQQSIHPDLALGFEAVVGLMLIGLGGHVFYRLHRDRVHFHRHIHSDGSAHVHLHSHSNDDVRHKNSAHEHTHTDKTPWRVLLVGMMHGLAGSAAVITGTAAAMDSPIQGILFIVVFGIGSVLGMGLASLLLSLPLTFSTAFFNRSNMVLQLAIGTITIGVGLYVFTGSALAFIAN